MTEKEKQNLVENMKKKGFSQKEIDKVLQGILEEEKGLLKTPEEVYKSLFISENVYV